jgi:hypothetical protein
VDVLREFAEKQAIPFPLLSDVDSAVIDRFGIRNEEAGPDAGPLYGIPYPGCYVTDEDGVVVAKSFHDSYKKRDSPEILIDAALGRVTLDPGAPRAEGGESAVRITASLRGGRGTLRQGMRRHLVVRFELEPGLHLYGEPVPEGMIPTRVEVRGPEGLVAEPALLPPTTPLRLEGLDLELPVWSGSFDFVVPLYATGALASETRPLDTDRASLEVCIRYQACDDETCLLPKEEKLSLDVPLDVIDVPRLGMHEGHGQREAAFDGRPHMRRLVLRKLRREPLGFLRFVAKSIRLEWQALRRRRRG